MLIRNTYLAMLKRNKNIVRFALVFAEDISSAERIANENKTEREQDCYFIVRNLDMPGTMYNNSEKLNYRDIGIYEFYHR